MPSKPITREDPTPGRKARAEEPAPKSVPDSHPPRAVVESVRPEIDGGRFPVKRVVGESVAVEADVFTDGHDVVVAELLYRPADEAGWSTKPMEFLGNDRWRAPFTVTKLGGYVYAVRGRVDRFLSWRRDLGKKAEAGQDVALDLLSGAALVSEAAGRATGEDATRLADWSAALGDARGAQAERVALALGEDLLACASRHPDLADARLYERELRVEVDPVEARFSTWYEMFPRSCSPVPGRHGSLRDCEARLGYVAEMGFDVLYLPPIHPIGRAHRKGRNGAVTAEPGDCGSPWAIGAVEGGHKAVHPELGTLEDFRRLVAKARELGIQVALDIAFQCSPDHPYVREHPEWFRHRPDGSVQYAENPPKKYEDIYPFEFENPDWRGLWEELLSVFEFWLGQGVMIFRVDNPHTKPFEFWEWVIGEVRRKHPGVIFLSEAFTRPRVMYRLAKLGFTQSYTYFAWRHTRWEIAEYLGELTRSEVREFFRPNLWPNTPDILTESLQFGGRATFMTRVALAATLSSSYGIYGPAYELCEDRPRHAGSEEYLDSEKYEIRNWDLTRGDSLKEFIGRLNRIRRENPALQSNDTLAFHVVDNPQLLAYSKTSPDQDNAILTVVNLDPHHVQSGWLELPAEELGLDTRQPYQAHDLLTGARYFWQGSRNYVEIDPRVVPAHVFRLRRRVRTERDFDYFL